MAGIRAAVQQRGHFRFKKASGQNAPSGPKLAAALAVLGIVYGDIGTSPIYGFRQAFTGATPVAVAIPNVLGVLSLIFWTLIIVISLKYMTFVLQANNRGEGGIFALIALLRPWRDMDRRRRHWLILFGLLGAALLYGGVIITPAISILSAVGGLMVATPLFAPYVVPITIIILVLLFLFQSKGTARVGAVFGPVMVLWFAVMAALGIVSIAKTPGVLVALSPTYAVAFFRHNGLLGFMALYAVFLVTTGGEALYADLGHFDAKRIRRMWFGFVLPALLLNYFGQAAELLRYPIGNPQPFYHMAPHWMLYPLVGLATAATIIASQAAITGAFSLTRQAIQLGLMPPFKVTQTSEEVHGQIYVAAVNWFLMIATIAVVLMFQTSSALAAAYGAAVSGTMVVTTVLAFNVAREVGGWKRPAALAFLVGFLAVDLSFLGSNALKIPFGGWFPILIGLGFFAIMSTWRRGGEILTAIAEKESERLDTLIGEIENRPLARVPGTAVFLTAQVEGCPLTLRHHVRWNKALQEQVIVLTVLVEDVARVSGDDRIEVDRRKQGFTRMILHYGYMQGVNVPSELAREDVHGLHVDMDDVTYYIGTQSLIPTRKQGGMVAWRDHLFAYMARNATDPTDHYHVPSQQTVVLGQRVRF